MRLTWCVDRLNMFYRETYGAHLYIVCVFGIHLQFAKIILIIRLYNHAVASQKTDPEFSDEH